jgi:hypothetical protein
MESPTRFRASLLDSALDSLLIIKTISLVSTCRDNSWGAGREHPSQSYRLGSRHPYSADHILKDDDGIPYTIPSVPPGLSSCFSASVCRDKSWGAVHEDPIEPKPSQLDSPHSRSNRPFDSERAPWTRLLSVSFF